MRLTQFIITLALAATFFACEKTSKSNIRSNSNFTSQQKDSLNNIANLAAMQTFKAMSSALKQAMREGGVKKAVSFCNLEAQPIADSLSMQYGVQISRVSDRARNELNKASKKEEELITNYQLLLDHKKELGNEMVLSPNEKPIIYKPIQIKALCLNCHGTIGKELTAENASFIKQLYLEDRATGYKEGDLRGMWKIEFTGDL